MSRIQTRLLRHTVASAAIATSLFGFAATTQAANHALILWIGDYANPNARLPGIDIDAQRARRIATAMGVPPNNIVEVSNSSLPRDGMARQIQSLTDRIGSDDKVFVYYSGHGGQTAGSNGSKCTEGLYAYDSKLYSDDQLQQALDRLGRRASQVVMMNDSCFSGGAATKDDGARGIEDDAVVKSYPVDDKAIGVNDPSYACGIPINKGALARNFELIGNRERAPQLLYIAASADNEVSFATRQGSVATMAWEACIGSADVNRSGMVDGEELRACAQRLIDRGNIRQHITLVGNARLPLTFVASQGSAASGGRINPASLFGDLRNAADPSHTVSLQAPRSLRIGHDPLDFSLQTNRSGYLYVFQVGSDEKTVNLLFPNRFDENNYVNKGTHQFPHPSWRVRAGGPTGTSYLFAIVSPTLRKDFAKHMDISDAMPKADATSELAKVLYVEGTGGGSVVGSRFGASQVVGVREIQ